MRVCEGLRVVGADRLLALQHARGFFALLPWHYFANERTVLEYAGHG